MCDAHVADVSERDSQSVAVIVEVSDVGWFTWLWGKWCETPGDQKSYPLPESLKVVLSPCCSCTHQAALSQTTTSAETTSALMKIHKYEKKKNHNHTFFFFLTSLLCGWPQMTAHKEPNWVLLLSLRHDLCWVPNTRLLQWWKGRCKQESLDERAPRPSSQSQHLVSFTQQDYSKNL